MGYYKLMEKKLHRSRYVQSMGNVRQKGKRLWRLKNKPEERDDVREVQRDTGTR